MSKLKFNGSSLPIAGKKTIVIKASWDQVKNEIKPWIKENNLSIYGVPFRVRLNTSQKQKLEKEEYWGFKFKDDDHKMFFKLTWVI